MGISVGMLELVIGIAVILATAIGFWVNINNEYTKIRSRVYHLEQSDNEIKVALADIATKLQHIEILLASNQIRDKSK